MDRRRLTGVIAAVAFIVLVGGLAYFDAYFARKPAETAAFAPAGATTEPAPATGGAAAPGSEVAATAPDAGTAATDAAPGTGSAAGTGAGAPAPAVAMVNPNDGAPAVTPPMPGPPVVPSFDVVRVEPSGDAVIAGQAAPESKVEMLDGTTTIATAEANENGEWAMALDKPLAPGPHDLSVRTTSKDEKVATLSDQRVTVSVPEPGSKDVLVVMNTPDSASRVLQVPGAEAAKPGEQVASANPPPAAGTEAAKPGQEVVAAAPPAEVKPGEQVATAAEPPAAGSAADEAAKPDEQVAAAEPPAAGTAADEAAKPGEQVATEEPPSTATAEGKAAKPGEQVATAEPLATGAGAAKAGGGVGAGASSGEAKVNDQVTAAPAGGEAPLPTEPSVGAEPKIALESPLPTEPTVKGEAPIKGEAPVKVEPPLGEGSAAETQPKVEPPPTPEVAVAAVEADTAGSVYVAGTVATPETVRVYIDDQPIGEARPSPSGTWLIETKRDMPAGKYTVRVDQLDAGGNVIARSEVPFEREVEVAILKPTGTVGAGSGGATLSAAMPEMETVIIKRGDNLWHIARGAWGKGIRWSTIYQANTDQIRNPHWIYPGQVFIMPKGNAAWTD